MKLSDELARERKRLEAAVEKLNLAIASAEATFRRLELQVEADVELERFHGPGLRLRWRQHDNLWRFMVGKKPLCDAPLYHRLCAAQQLPLLLAAIRGKQESLIEQIGLLTSDVETFTTTLK